MKKSFLVLISAVVVSAACSASVDPRFTEAAEKRIESARTAVAAEAASESAPAWAGEYFADGVSLVVAPKGGFVFERKGDTRVFDRNLGPVSLRDEALHLLCVYPNHRDSFHGVAPDLVSVTWGGRRYLVASDAMLDFCNSVNLGLEPRREMFGAHLLRAGDESKAVTGLPKLPAEFSRYLLATPVESDVLSVTSEKLRASEGAKYTVVLKAGAKKGLFAGMELRAKTDAGTMRLKLNSVTDESAEGEILVLGAGEAPVAGMKFSSR